MIIKNLNGDIYGKAPFFEVREIKTIRDLFMQSTELFKDRVGFLQKYDAKAPYKEITYAQYKSDVIALAEGLIELGLKDKKIAVMGENRYEWAVSYMSVVTGVGIVTPLDKELPFSDIKNLLEFAECSAIICTSSVLKKNPQIAEMDIKVISMDKDFNELIEKGRKLIENGSRVYENLEVQPDDVDIILFTSGTCSSPKGVMLTHKNICSNIMNICSLFKIDHNDRVFSVLPLHHTYECTCGYLTEVYVGSSIAYCQGLKYMLKNIQESKPTIFLSVPMILESIYKLLNRTIDKEGKRKKVNFALALSKTFLKLGIDIRRKLFGEIHEKFGGKLKLFLVGAAPVDPDIMQFFTDIGITSIQGYGMTECSPIITENRVSHFRNDSVGLPVPELLLKTDNENDGEQGEIMVKGDNVMVGYYKNPEETEKVFKDGWFLTGDMGYIKDGFVYLTGRKKNVIITSNGENVFPEEIEQELTKSDYIEECVVFSEDNQLHVQVYPNKEIFEEEKIDIEETIKGIINQLNENSPIHKRINKVIVREKPFIKTTTHKIKRNCINDC